MQGSEEQHNKEQEDKKEVRKEHKKEDRYEALQQARKNLPIYEYRDEILQALSDTQTLVVIGETGSGKSTQISQYLDEAGYTRGGLRIGITQPRRVGAVSVARRVAEEYGCELGKEVGYTVRFTDKTDSSTRIKYMTDGTLLRECLEDPELSSVIILDEAHERSVHTDILFGLMKEACARRPDLKLLITSATLEEEKFSNFFGECPVFVVPGRSYPVDIYYLEDNAKQVTADYIDAAVDTVLKIHESEPEGDILVFLPGQAEIEAACRRIEKNMVKLYEKYPEIDDLVVLPLYAALPPGDQVRVFEPTPPRARKVVVSTNIAETSLTVDGIVYVVDPGYVKQKGFNPRTGMETLQVTMISQVAAAQRAGRAGRTRPGKCFRLYRRSVFEEMDPATVPEIQRTNLANTVLCLKALGINDILGFQFLDPPDAFLLIQATRQLYYLGALDEDGNLTELGKQMSKFPLEPSFSRMLLASVDLKCSEEMLTLIAMLSIENIFYKPHEKDQQEEADKARAKLTAKAEVELDTDITGDHFLLLYIFETWKKHKESVQWCQDYFIQPRHLHEAADIRRQLLDLMKQQRLEVLSSGRSKSIKYERLAQAICSGLFMNTARRALHPSAIKKNPNQRWLYYVLKQNLTAHLHPQCALISSNKPQPEYVVYTEMVCTTRPFLRTVCGIKYEWVESKLEQMAHLDVNRLMGRNVKDIIAASMAKAEPVAEENESLERELAQKFARRNDDASISAAKERYLKRLQAKKGK